MHLKKSYMLIPVIIAVVVTMAGCGWIFLRQPSFGRLPSGERLERIKRSPNYRDGEFKNLLPTRLMTGNNNRWRAMWNFVFSAKDSVRPSFPLHVVKTDLKNLPPDENLMVWFGHSSYLLQVDGIRVLVDPVFLESSPLPFVNRPFEGTDLYKPEDMPDIDYLVISHDHWDHLDYKTVCRLRRHTRKVICPLGVGEHFEHWGYDKASLVELDWMEKTSPDRGFVVQCLPARHFSGRGLKSNQSLWASFMLSTPSLTIFIGGDSGYGSHFGKIAELYPHIDWAILENGQYNEDWKYIHTLPHQIARVAKDLAAKHIVTVHHSKFALARHRWDEPLHNARRMRDEDSLEVAMPAIGEVLSLDSGRKT